MNPNLVVACLANYLSLCKLSGSCSVSLIGRQCIRYGNYEPNKRRKFFKGINRKREKEKKWKRKKKCQFFGEKNIKQLEQQKKHFHVKVENMGVKMLCEYCGEPVNTKPKVLEFANFQSFFCCIGCKRSYREKHAGRRQSIVEQYKEMEKEAKRLA